MNMNVPNAQLSPEFLALIARERQESLHREAEQRRAVREARQDGRTRRWFSR